MVSPQLPPLQPSGLWIRSHPYLASFTHMKDCLTHWIQNILLKTLWMRTVWRTSHSCTFSIPHFHVKYLNVWINSQVKLGSSSQGFSLQFPNDFIKLVNLSMHLASSFLKLRHLLRLETGFQVRHQGKNSCEYADPYLPRFTLPAPVLAHFSLDSPSTPVLWKRHPSHFTAPELLEIGMKVRGDCNKTEMNFFIINY